MNKVYKAYVRLPLVLLDNILGKLFNYIPMLNIKYLEFSAMIDFDRSLSPNTLKDPLEAISIESIWNKKIRRSLMASGVFRKWNAYLIHGRKVEEREIIYLSKDILSTGDTIYGQRLSDIDLSSEYTNSKIRRTLKSKGVSDISELEPYVYIISAKDSIRHTELKKERTIRNKKKAYKKITRDVNKCIKDDNIFRYSDSWSNTPLFIEVIKEERIDLVEKMLMACIDDDERKKLVNLTPSPYDSAKWTRPLDMNTTLEMKNVLNLYK